jgi:hypothetical protein
MGLPVEDQGPQSLRTYGFTDFGNIAADIHAMEEFASRLAANVTKDYIPHADRVTEAMSASLPEPIGFPELHDFITAHRAAQDATRENIYNFGTGTEHLATAAKLISDRYRGTDAIARAKVSDVERAFNTMGTESTSSTTPRRDG